MFIFFNFDNMKQEMLQIKVAIQISKPPEVVFEAIVDPVKMSNYFISESTGTMQAHTLLKWKFPEFDDEFRVKTDAIERNKYISFYWDSEDGMEMFVEIRLMPIGKNSTLVSITEKERENDEAGIKWLMGNTEGWANFLACLKAYLEYGINLRTGGFDYLINRVAGTNDVI